MLRIAIGYNTCHYAWMMRLELIKAFQAANYDVVLLAPLDEYAPKLEEAGVTIYPIPMKMNKNPVTDLVLMMRLRRALKAVKPDVYLGYTAKPNIYGTLAASSLGIPSINNIAGLGAGFVSESLVTRVMKRLYRTALSKSAMVFFQNPDDAALFKDEGIVRHDRTMLLPGSGVNLDRFQALPTEPRTKRKFRFLLVARMLWDKGIGEYAEAARRISETRDDVEFLLLGNSDVDNPAAIPKDTIDGWVNGGFIDYRGYSDAIAEEIRKADCVVLPSYYREGTPRVMLEAAASGRPVITADSVGCREAVRDGETGFLCVPRDANDLQAKMVRMLDMPENDLAAMGQAGRRFAEEVFDERIVIDRYLSAISSVSK